MKPALPVSDSYTLSVLHFSGSLDDEIPEPVCFRTRPAVLAGLITVPQAP